MRVATAATLRGVFAPLTVPFKSNGDVDLAGVRTNAEFYLKSSLHGLVVLGSTGEVITGEFISCIDTHFPSLSQRQVSVADNRREEVRLFHCHGCQSSRWFVEAAHCWDGKLWMRARCNILVALGCQLQYIEKWSRLRCGDGASTALLQTDPASP